MIQKLKVHTMQDVSDVVCILVKNNYICEAKAVYKKFPEDEHSIDFFQVSYWRDDERGDEE